MARYLSLHSLACLTRQGAEELVARLAVPTSSAFELRRVAVNLTEGKMMVEYEAAEREDIEGWLAKEKFHCDWLLRVELERRGGKLAPIESGLAPPEG